jgi:hypothetical protein
MIEKYELYIEDAFEPYAAMHDSRQHSNLWGKMLIYNNDALQNDHIGYYKPVLRSGKPTSVHFHEQYPHMVTPWVYDEKFLNEDFNYDDLEKKYLNNASRSNHQASEVKEQLDQAHRL